jgi:hypothetical protein
MADDQLLVTIDLTDWDAERLALGADLTTVDKIIEAQLQHRLSAMQVARLIVAGRERQAAPTGALPPNKTLIQTGGAHEWMRATEPAAGEAPYMVGGTRGDTGYVAADNPEATDRATAYLLGPLIGHIESRLAIIAGNHGDVAGVAQQVKGKIDGLVAALEALPPGE